MRGTILCTPAHRYLFFARLPGPSQAIQRFRASEVAAPPQSLARCYERRNTLPLGACQAGPEGLALLDLRGTLPLDRHPLLLPLPFPPRNHHGTRFQRASSQCSIDPAILPRFPHDPARMLVLGQDTEERHHSHRVHVCLCHRLHYPDCTVHPRCLVLRHLPYCRRSLPIYCTRDCLVSTSLRMQRSTLTYSEHYPGLDLSLAQS